MFDGRWINVLEEFCGRPSVLCFTDAKQELKQKFKRHFEGFGRLHWYSFLLQFNKNGGSLDIVK